MAVLPFKMRTYLLAPTVALSKRLVALAVLSRCPDEFQAIKNGAVDQSTYYTSTTNTTSQRTAANASSRRRVLGERCLDDSVHFVSLLQLFDKVDVEAKCSPVQHSKLGSDAPIA